MKNLYARFRFHNLAILQRLFILYLVIAVLGYGTAVVADVHSISDQIHLVASDLDDDLNDDADYDHCYHGTAHVLGLRCHVAVINFSVAPDIASSAYVSVVPFISPDLLLRPPILG